MYFCSDFYSEGDTASVYERRRSECGTWSPRWRRRRRRCCFASTSSRQHFVDVAGHPLSRRRVNTPSTGWNLLQRHCCLLVPGHSPFEWYAKVAGDVRGGGGAGDTSPRIYVGDANTIVPKNFAVTNSVSDKTSNVNSNRLIAQRPLVSLKMSGIPLNLGPSCWLLANLCTSSPSFETRFTPLVMCELQLISLLTLSSVSSVQSVALVGHPKAERIQLRGGRGAFLQTRVQGLCPWTLSYARTWPRSSCRPMFIPHFLPGDASECYSVSKEFRKETAFPFR